MNARDESRAEYLRRTIEAHRQTIGAFEMRILLPPLGVSNVDLYRETCRAGIVQLEAQIAACEGQIAALSAQLELAL